MNSFLMRLKSLGLVKTTNIMIFDNISTRLETSDKTIIKRGWLPISLLRHNSLYSGKLEARGILNLIL